MATSSQLTTLLLSPSELDKILGTKGIQPGKIYDTLEEQPKATDPKCANIAIFGSVGLFGRTGWRGQEQHFARTEDPPRRARQLVANSPNAKFTKASIAAVKEAWKSCPGKPIQFAQSDREEQTWQIGDVALGTESIVFTATAAATDAGSAPHCQHALRAKSNVIIETMVCAAQLDQQAVLTADQIAAKIH